MRYRTFVCGAFKRSEFVKTSIMAAEKKGEILTNHQIMMVAAEISVKNMKIIAKEYFKLPIDLTDELVSENVDDEESFKRAVIRRWANMNYDQQVKVTRTSNVFYHVTDNLRI